MIQATLPTYSLDELQNWEDTLTGPSRLYQPQFSLNSNYVSVNVIEASESSVDGTRLLTLSARYWRSIHAEVMTHRDFSRNASSSRAIPVSKFIEQVLNNPAGPMHWGSNQSGMQAGPEIDTQVKVPLEKGYVAISPSAAWKESATRAAAMAEAFNKAGYHKQLVNRILEPYQYIDVIITSTEWQNFFNLRAHPDAQPEIQHLAEMIRDAHSKAVYTVLEPGQYHLPFVTKLEREHLPLDLQKMVSAARCARVSYNTHGGESPNIVKDYELFQRLVGAAPIHASPIEHQATPAMFAGRTSQTRNFSSWNQYRDEWETLMYAI